MIEVKKFMCDFDCLPSDEELKMSIDMANKTNTVIEICWITKYLGPNSIYIRPNSDFDELKNSLLANYDI